VIGEIFEQVFKDPECASTVKKLLCNSAFRQCQQVKDPLTGENVWVPALLCRSECEQIHDIYSQCVADLDGDEEAISRYESQMASLTPTMRIPLDIIFFRDIPRPLDAPFRLFDCDVSGGDRDQIADEDAVASFIVGRWPATHADNPMSLEFPVGMSTSAMWPEESSQYLLGDVEVEVACFIPGVTEVISEVNCPLPFLSSTEEGTNAPCVFACPVPAYDSDQYSAMWSITVLLGLWGLSLNGMNHIPSLPPHSPDVPLTSSSPLKYPPVWMLATWWLGGKKSFKEVKPQLKACVYFGLLYGFVETVPVLLLSSDLPCDSGCTTEECVGGGALCAINRASIYILLGILINLAGVTFNLWHALEKGTQPNASREKIVNGICYGLPMALLILAYAFDSPDNFDQSVASNGQLNTARHAFTCSMRFESMVHEWILLWSHFLFFGTAIVVFTFGSILKIRVVTSRVSVSASSKGASSRAKGGMSDKHTANRNSEIKSVQRRLLNIALTVGLPVDQHARYVVDQRKLERVENFVRLMATMQLV
jgi:hypothetical protein